MPIDPGNAIFFFALALIAVVAAIAMLRSVNAVHAALFLVVNFAAVAILYLTLNAPFIALAQITVYAGAIMVLFLFVIMLLGGERIPLGETLPWQRPLALVLVLGLLAQAIYALLSRAAAAGPAGQIDPAIYGSPAAIGLTLFGKYIFAFEITSVLLLVAMIGAVVLTKSERRLPGESARATAQMTTELTSSANGSANGRREPAGTRQLP